MFLLTEQLGAATLGLPACDTSFSIRVSAQTDCEVPVPNPNRPDSSESDFSECVCVNELFPAPAQREPKKRRPFQLDCVQQLFETEIRSVSFGVGVSAVVQLPHVDEASCCRMQMQNVRAPRERNVLRERERESRICDKFELIA